MKETHLRPALPVQYLERGSPCPRKSGHLWPIPHVFESCLFNRNFSLGMLQCFPLFSGTFNWGPVERMLERFRGWSAQLWVHIDCVGSRVLGRLPRRDLGFPGHEVLGRGVQVGWRHHCAKEAMGSHCGWGGGACLRRVVQEVGMSAVLQAASAGCRNSDKVMVCQDVPVSELRMEGDEVGLCGRRCSREQNCAQVYGCLGGKLPSADSDLTCGLWGLWTR